MRDRLALLLDPDSFVEDGLLANDQAATTCPPTAWSPASGRIDGRPVCVMANDPTVKAGSWGARTVEKIVRLTEHALRHELPVFWLVDSAGARITDQVELFPGRRGAGRIFYNQVRLSGRVPQICCLFGPSAAGGAYIPSFCDVVFMVEGNASMYLGSPRMAEMVIGEVTTLEEMGGARMHATVSGCGDNLAVDDDGRHRPGPGLLHATSRQSWREPPAPVRAAAEPARAAHGRRRAGRGARRPTTCTTSSTAWSTPSRSSRSSRCSPPSWSPGSGCSTARPVGIVANNPMAKGGVLFVDSADKAARFIWLCDAFNIPLVFLADVPGFMVGTEVERARASSATGPRWSPRSARRPCPRCRSIVRKAYGAGLYAMSGPAFEPEATLALPTAKIAVMGPEAAVNAVFANTIAAIDDPDERAAFVEAEQRASTRRTSTCCGWPPSWWSTRSSTSATCAAS